MYSQNPETPQHNKPSFRQRFGITREKLFASLLAAFSLPYVLLVGACFNVYFANTSELGFTFTDFAPTFLLYSLGFFLIFFAILILTKKTLHNIFFSLFSGFVLCGYIQYIITNITFEGLPADGNTKSAPDWYMVLNLVVWIILLGAAVYLGSFFSSREKVRKAMCFLLILVIVMQTASMIPSAVTYAGLTPEEKNTAPRSYLSTRNITELSHDGNVVVFVLDRFDKEYLEELIRDNPNALRDFDGFTYYRDNIATYPRTYPAITSMLTGVKNDFGSTRGDYFKEAYGTSEFLSDLHENNYKVNIYTPSYYSYESADIFGDYVSNISVSEGHHIASYTLLDYKLFCLGSYFWLPDAIKSNKISANAFSDMIVLESDAPQYAIENDSDPEFYTQLTQEKLRTQDKHNTFTFLHLRGCHSPFAMNEECEYVPEYTATSLQQTKGCFRILSEYIAQMKMLGIYDDSTIIITGDHAALKSSNAVEYREAHQTALLVKEKGEHGTDIKYSDAQVSQENLIPTIIKSEGINTDTDYGRAYSEVPEGDDVLRTHYFQLDIPGAADDENITYEIYGDGSDFNNWKITNRKTIDSVGN